MRPTLSFTTQRMKRNLKINRLSSASVFQFLSPLNLSNLDCSFSVKCTNIGLLPIELTAKLLNAYMRTHRPNAYDVFIMP